MVSKGRIPAVQTPVGIGRTRTSSGRSRHGDSVLSSPASPPDRLLALMSCQQLFKLRSGGLRATELASNPETEQFGRSRMPRWNVGQWKVSRRDESCSPVSKRLRAFFRGRRRSTGPRTSHRCSARRRRYLQGTFAWLTPNLISCSTDAHAPYADRRYVAVVVMGWLSGAPRSR